MECHVNWCLFERGSLKRNGGLKIWMMIKNGETHTLRKGWSRVPLKQPGFKWKACSRVFWNDRHLQVCHITPRGEGRIEASELSISTLAKISTENAGGNPRKA